MMMEMVIGEQCNNAWKSFISHYLISYRPSYAANTCGPATGIYILVWCIGMGMVYIYWYVQPYYHHPFRGGFWILCFSSVEPSKPRQKRHTRKSKPNQSYRQICKNIFDGYLTFIVWFCCLWWYCWLLWCLTRSWWEVDFVVDCYGHFEQGWYRENDKKLLMMTLIIMRRCKNNASVSRQLCKFLQEREENRGSLMMIYLYIILWWSVY